MIFIVAAIYSGIATAVFLWLHDDDDHWFEAFSVALAWPVAGLILVGGLMTGFVSELWRHLRA